MSDNIPKVCSLVKRLSHHLIKLDKNYRSYYLNSITVVFYFLYICTYVISSNEVLVQKIFRIFDGS